MKPPLDPILIHITPDFGIHWYGILIVSGVMLGTVYAAWRAKQDGEDPDHVWNGLIIAIILGIIGSRLYHVFSEPEGGMVGWSYYRQHPIEILYIWHGGLGIYGAIAGGVLGAVIYARRNNLRPLQWLDYGAPGLALGQAIPKAARDGLAKPIVPHWMYWLIAWKRWNQDAKGYGAKKLLKRQPYLAKAR